MNNALTPLLANFAYRKPTTRSTTPREKKAMMRLKVERASMMKMQ